MKLHHYIISGLVIIIIVMSFFVRNMSMKSELRINTLDAEKLELMRKFSQSRKISDSLERNTAVLKRSIFETKQTLSEREKALQALKKRSKTYQYVQKYTDTRLDSFFMARYPRTDVRLFDSASDRK